MAVCIITLLHMVANGGLQPSIHVYVNLADYSHNCQHLSNSVSLTSVTVGTCSNSDAFLSCSNLWILAAVAERLCSKERFLAFLFKRGELAIESFISFTGPVTKYVMKFSDQIIDKKVLRL